MNGEAIIKDKRFWFGKHSFHFMFNYMKVSFNCTINSVRDFILKHSSLFIVLILFVFTAVFVVFIPEKVPGLVMPLFTSPSPVVQLLDAYSVGEEQAELEKQILATNRKIGAVTPRSFYMVINSSGNEFKLYKGDKLIRSGLCSTGSYIKLEAEDNKHWIFKTPRGEYKILGKTVDPVWRRPDWAFVEEGIPVPSANHSSRFEYGVLGDYALSLGDGYLIHGTLYQRFLGLPVTHGCVRLNDDDLEEVYKSLGIGSKVFIY